LSEEEKVQSLVSELRVIETYTTEINNRISMIARAIMENRSALELIKTYPDKKITEILVAIGGGLFLKASAPPPEKFIVNVGAQLALEKTKDNAISYIEERLKELENAVNTLESQRIELSKKMESNKIQINSLVQKQRQ
jgi:prefoldin alpha subunit